MKNMRVSVKLMVAFAITIVLSIGIGLVGIFGMQSISDSSTEMYYYQLEPITYMAFAKDSFQDIRVQAREVAIHTGDQASIDASEAAMNESERLFLYHFENFREFLITDEGQRLAGEIDDAFNRVYYPGIHEIVAAARDGAPVYELMLIFDRLAESANTISDGLEGIIEIRVAQARYLETANETLARNLLIAIIIVLAVAVGLSVFLAIYISGLISKPLKALTTFMVAAAKEGELYFTEEEEKAFAEFESHRDELGETLKATHEFVLEIIHEMDDLEKIANGDLSIVPNILSERDKVGNALTKVVDNLNGMFAEINSATGQVSVGSKQIADGAQTLAQGSTEQAASVQQLSASIGEIALKTKENAEKAERAASLASTIMSNAEKGSRQMSEMTEAVREINQASQSIGKVIKVIEDIAFQTNILALNAAVEAARAGQHGKGFAVVAEEVRNLAAKSAEAAKDTGGLIQNSMEKAELGSRIADETAESLTEIVAGIEESGQIINDIAISSEEQSSGIDQINTGIDQVAQVVQQNSATAQESAAASEEMSSQSTMLESLVAQFKLRNSGLGAPSLPPKSPTPSAQTSPIVESDNDHDNFGKY